MTTLRANLVSVLEAADRRAAFNKLVEGGALDEIPGFAALRDCRHDRRYHCEGTTPEDEAAGLGSTVEGHTLVVVDAVLALPRIEFVDLATAIVHDLGKPGTRSEKEGKIMFVGHDKAGADMIDSVASALGLTPAEAEAVSFATRNHMKAHLYPEMRPSKRDALSTSPHWIHVARIQVADAFATVGPDGQPKPANFGFDEQTGEVIILC